MGSAAGQLYPVSWSVVDSWDGGQSQGLDGKGAGAPRGSGGPCLVLLQAPDWGSRGTVAGDAMASAEGGRERGKPVDSAGLWVLWTQPCTSPLRELPPV